jgi:hypothetical protein
VSSRNGRAVNLLFSLVAAALFAASFTSFAFAQQKPGSPAGVPDDWSHHRLVFSNPGTAEQAQGNGTYERWLRTVSDPRFAMQQAKRNAMQHSPATEAPAPPLAKGEFTATAESSRQEIVTQGPQPAVQAKPRGDWSMDMGSEAKVGAGQYPAKWSFAIDQAFCDSDSTPDYVVYNTGSPSTQPSIIAYDNLYSGCSGAHPLIYWQYNTNGGSIPTSVVLSEAGDQVAFIQASPLAASLVVLKWAKNASLVTLTNTAAGSYRACTAPCMTALLLHGSPSAMNSAPFYDYANDVLYVGDDSGVLHKFTGIFFGTPAEITGGGTASGWPQTILSGTGLTSPVYDSTSGNVFVAAGNILGRIPAGGGSANLVTSGTLVNIGDAPVVDSTAATVYVVGGAPSATVRLFQLTTTFASGSTGASVAVGSTGDSPVYYDGAFDNAYFTGDGSSPSGNLWVCGSSTGSNAGVPALWQVPISANTMGTPVGFSPLASAAATCSPLTEFYNANDLIFLGVEGSGLATACAGGGCAMSFPVMQWYASTHYRKLQAIVDSNGNVEIDDSAGTSGMTQPQWPTRPGGTISDGSTGWINQGPFQANHYAAWTANHSYSFDTEIIDSNGKIEVASANGTSGGTAPAWNTQLGGLTRDNTIFWTQVGVPANNATAATSGTSGIIVDNEVTSPTGTSQVYFSTLGSQSCAGNGSVGSGTGGCAIQASQAALQ